MKRSNTIVRASSIAAVAAVALAACSVGGGSSSTGSQSVAAASGGLEDMKPVKLRFSTLGAETGGHGAGVKAMSEYLQKETNGKITIEPFYAGALLKPGEEIPGTAAGTSDLTILISNLAPKQTPALSWVQENFGFGQPTKYPEGMIQANMLLEKVFHDSKVDAELRSKGVIPLTPVTIEYGYMLVCNKAINSLATAKGKTNRVGGEPWSSETKALGMQPVSLAITESFEALQRGAIDCSTGVPPTAMSFGFLQVAKHVVPVKMGSNYGVALIMGRDKMEQLPKAAQDIIQKAAYRFAAAGVIKGLTDYQSFAKEVASKDITLEDATELNAAVLKFQQERLAKALTNAPAGIDGAAYEAQFKTWTEEANQATTALTGGDLTEPATSEDLQKQWAAGVPASLTVEALAGAMEKAAQ